MATIISHPLHGDAMLSGLTQGAAAVDDEREHATRGAGSVIGGERRVRSAAPPRLGDTPTTTIITTLSISVAEDPLCFPLVYTTSVTTTTTTAHTANGAENEENSEFSSSSSSSTAVVISVGFSQHFVALLQSDSAVAAHMVWEASHRLSRGYSLSRHCDLLISRQLLQHGCLRGGGDTDINAKGPDTDPAVTSLSHLWCTWLIPLQGWLCGRQKHFWSLLVWFFLMTLAFRNLVRLLKWRGATFALACVGVLLAVPSAHLFLARAKIYLL
jgi:hypothetical protein